MIPETKARRGLCIPVYKTETTLSVAMADPLDIFAADDIKRILRTAGLELEIEPLLAFPKDIEKKLEEIYGLGDTIVQEILEGIQEHDDIQVEAADEEEEDEDLDIARSMELAQKGPIIGLVNAILVAAVKQGASDIHIEPFRKKSLLRFRIDTILVEVPTIPLPRSRHNAIVSRIKIMSHCDIAERRRPQDGRLHVKAGGKEYDLRVSILPSACGESVVMRIADTDSSGYSLEQLGFLPNNLEIFQHAIEQPYGLILGIMRFIRFRFLR
jgi:type IV pilus assembly protein PilB